MSPIFRSSSMRRPCPRDWPMEGSFWPVIVQPTSPTRDAPLRMWTTRVVGPQYGITIATMRRSGINNQRISGPIINKILEFGLPQSSHNDVLFIAFTSAVPWNLPLQGAWYNNLRAVAVATTTPGLIADLANCLWAHGAPSQPTRLTDLMQDFDDIYAVHGCFTDLTIVGNSLVMAPRV